MWLLLDECDEQQDARLAAHIINVHQGRVGTAAAADGAAGSSRQQAGTSSSNSSRVSRLIYFTQNENSIFAGPAVQFFKGPSNKFC